MKPCIAIPLIAATLLFASCATQQPPPGGYSKAEQAQMREEQRQRRAAWRAIGVSVVRFGLNAAAAGINGEDGFRK